MQSSVNREPLSFVVEEKPVRVTTVYDVFYKQEIITLEQDVDDLGEIWWIKWEDRFGTHVYSNARPTKEECLKALQLYIETGLIEDER